MLAFALFALGKWQSGKVPRRRFKVELFYLNKIWLVKADVEAELAVVEELVVVEALDGAVDVDVDVDVDVGAELDVVGELVVARLVAVDVLPAVDVLLKNDTFQLKFSIPIRSCYPLEQRGKNQRDCDCSPGSRR